MSSSPHLLPRFSHLKNFFLNSNITNIFDSICHYLNNLTLFKWFCINFYVRKKTCLLSLNTTSYTKSMHTFYLKQTICTYMRRPMFLSLCRRLKITFRSRIESALLNKKNCRSSFVSNIIVITLKGSDVFGGCRDIKGIIYPFAHTVLFKCRLRFTNNAKIYSLLKVYPIL